MLSIYEFLSLGKSFYLTTNVFFMVYLLQEISVVEQEQLDNMMIQMDGTENKCESQLVILDDPSTSRVYTKLVQNFDI